MMSFASKLEQIIEEYEDPNQIDWNAISIYRGLSEGFIDKCQDKLHWNRQLEMPN